MESRNGVMNIHTALFCVISLMTFLHQDKNKLEKKTQKILNKNSQ